MSDLVKKEPADEHFIAFILGIPALVWFGYLEGVWTTLALFMVLYANNLSQSR